MKRRLRRKTVLVAAIAASFVVLLAVASFLSLVVWTSGLGSHFSRFALSDSHLPVTVTVFGRSTDTLSARIAFYNADGGLVGTLERSWPGWELKIDCIMVGTGKGWLAFPFLAYTDASSIGSGVDLVRFYNRDGFPVIYESNLMTRDERHSMSRLFSLVRTELWMPSVFGSLHHMTLSMRTFEPGTEYYLFVAKDGTLHARSN